MNKETKEIIIEALQFLKEKQKEQALADNLENADVLKKLVKISELVQAFATKTSEE